MEDKMLNCIMFDQDCFLDVRMLAADKRQRRWNLELLPAVFEVSQSEIIYTRQETTSAIGADIITKDYENKILKSLWVSNTVLLGSTHDGLYLEKGFSILCPKEGLEVNEIDLDILLFEYSGINIQQERISPTSNSTLCIEKTKFPGFGKLRIISPELKVRKSPVYFPTLKLKLFTDLKTSKFHSTNDEPVLVDAHALSGAIEDGLGTHYSDYVVALTMNELPQMAKSFINRDRHGWPSPDLIKKYC